MSAGLQPPNAPAPPAPQQSRPSWFARHKVLTGLLAVVVLVFLAKAFGGGEASPAASPRSSAPAAAKQADAPKVKTPKAETPKAETPKDAQVGQAVRDGKFEFTVTKVETGVAKVGAQYLNQKAQGQFVLVHVAVTNIGDEAQLLADSSQKVHDAKGREFSTDTGAGIYLEDNKVFLNEINPGNTVKGILVFDMPKDAKPATIELHDSPFSAGVTVRVA